MRIPKNIDVYGDTKYRGKRNAEECEVITFVAWLKYNHPDYHRLLIHPKIEGKKNPKERAKDASMGAFNVGASDQIIPCLLPFVVEVKQKDHTHSSISSKQIEYLEVAKRHGAFTGIALGSDGLKLAFFEWKKQQERIMNLWLTIQQCQ